MVNVGEAKQSSTSYRAVANRATDGNTDVDWSGLVLFNLRHSCPKSVLSDWWWYGV